MRVLWFCPKTCKDGNWPQSFSLPPPKGSVGHGRVDLPLLILAAIKFKNAVLCPAPEKCFHFNEIRCFPFLEAFLATVPSKVQVAPTAWFQILSKLNFQAPSQQLLSRRTLTGTPTSCNPSPPQALLCSCFLPIYCGFIPPSYRGVVSDIPTTTHAPSRVSLGLNFTFL